MSGAAPAAQAQESCLQVLHLKKSYGGRKVVKDVSLTVRKGEVVGLLGPNGAGKTTSFYMIVGLVRSDGGDIRIDEQSIANMPIHRRSRLGLSYLPQEASIFRKLNVQDNVRAVLELQTDAQGQPLSKAEIEERLTRLLEELRVEHLRDSPALALSGGERRRGSRRGASWPRRARRSSCPASRGTAASARSRRPAGPAGSPRPRAGPRSGRWCRTRRRRCRPRSP